MSKVVSRYLWWKLTSNTRRDYIIVFNSYIIFYTTHKVFTNFSFLSIFFYLLTIWCADLSDRNIASRTIKIYLCGFRFEHVDKNYFDLFVFEHSILNRVIRDIKRMRDDDVFKERKFITRDVLLKILNILDISIRQNVTLHAIFCLIFAIFFRINEFIWFSNNREIFDFAQWRVTKTFVILSINSLKLTLLFFKIDLFRKSVIIFVAAIHDIVCAVNSFRYLFKIFFALSRTSLFESIFEKVFFVKSIISTFRAILFRLNLQSHYFDYFFRREIVIEIKNADLFDSLIQMLNRWLFDFYTLYVDTNKNFVFRVSRQL